jgi:hypothetical protein
MLDQTSGVHIHFAENDLPNPFLKIDFHAASSRELITDGRMLKRFIQATSNPIIGSTMWCRGIASSNRRQHFLMTFVAYFSMLSRRYLDIAKPEARRSCHLGPYPSCPLLLTVYERVTIRGVPSSNRRHFYF